MKRIAVISRYPLEHETADGMSQRIIEVDDILSEYFELEYFDISFKRNTYGYKILRRSLGKIHRLVKEHIYNSILHNNILKKELLKYDLIYVHSIMNYIYIANIAPQLKNILILDLHGAVPEELFMEKKSQKSAIFEIIERMAVKRSNFLIHVSQAMKSHYKIKYPGFSGDFLFLPTSSKVNPDSNFRIHEGQSTPVVYAGGIQRWQNIDLMYKIVQENPNTNFEFFFPESILNEMRLKLVASNLSVNSLPRHVLLEEYNRFDFGFLLREDNVVNRIANPTKLFEYISRGIIPIVLSPNIGDLIIDGYRYVTTENFMDLSRQEIEKMRLHNFTLFKSNFLNTESLVQDFIGELRKVSYKYN